MPLREVDQDTSRPVNLRQIQVRDSSITRALTLPLNILKAVATFPIFTRSFHTAQLLEGIDRPMVARDKAISLSLVHASYSLSRASRRALAANGPAPDNLACSPSHAFPRLHSIFTLSTRSKSRENNLRPACSKNHSWIRRSAPHSVRRLKLVTIFPKLSFLPLFLPSVWPRANRKNAEYSSSVIAFYFCSNRRWSQLSHHTVFLSTDWEGSWASAFGKLPGGGLGDR